MPNSARPFKLNWASGGGLADRRDDRGPEFSIFVGDLGPEVNEYVLVSLFQSRFPSCKSAKIMTDPLSGMSRGYGFVRFSDESDQQRALSEMQGVYCGNRPMRISTATPKNKGGPMGGGPGGLNMPGAGPMGYPQQMGGPPIGYYGQQQQQQQSPQPMNQFTDPNNTTVFVGGLSGYVTEDELRSFFKDLARSPTSRSHLERDVALFNSFSAMLLRWPSTRCRDTPSVTLGFALVGVAARTTRARQELHTDQLHPHPSIPPWACLLRTHTATMRR